MKKEKENLTSIPRPPRRRRAAEAPAAGGSGQAEPKAPDLSYIAEGLRGLAVPIGDVVFFQDNPRKHGEKDLELTKASLERFGQVELLVVNKRESPPVVLNGNGRLQSALALGWSHVAVHFVDLDRDKANALAVTLNRTGEMAGWNAVALDALLREVSTNADPRLDAMLSELAAEMKILPQENGSAPDGGEQQPSEPETSQSKFHILIICKNGEEQAALLERLTSEGLSCRSLTE